MDVVTIAILVVEILGFAGAGVVIHRMKQQIGALDGTVKTQAEALQTVSDLNKIALEMARAFEPKKFADAVETYQKLVDRNAEAAVEEVRRTLQREHEKTKEQADSLSLNFDALVRLGFSLLAYIPPMVRDEAIARADLKVPMEEKIRWWFSQLAKQAPDLSLSNPDLREALYRALGEGRQG